MALLYPRCGLSLKLFLTCRARWITTSLQHFRAPLRRALTITNMNQNVRVMDYAVRGEVPNKAEAIRRKIEEGHKAPFNDLIKANIGNPQAMEQPHLTFVRQVLACCADPSLLDHDHYGEDVKRRAKEYLESFDGGSLGAYSDSLGVRKIREQVAEFIAARDGYPCSVDHVFLLNGASDGIRAMLTMCSNVDASEQERTGVMIPVPRYPLYSALITLLGDHMIRYHLDRDKNWQVDIALMRRVLEEAARKCTPRALVVINPGNPTGQYLPEENMREIVHFCKEHSLLLLADEVYQENIYEEDCHFHSFKKVLCSMGTEYSTVQLISFNSTSKGFLGECGMRGGYMEVVGLETEVLANLEKYFAVMLCPNVSGQVVTGTMVKPPSPGEASYPRYIKERDSILQALKRKALLMAELLNAIPGVVCNPVQGAMYAYPSITVPSAALADAEAADMKLDLFYCLKMVEAAGIVCVPGSGFGTHADYNFHFRITILPTEDKLEEMLDRFRRFHLSFCEGYEGKDSSNSLP